MVLARWSEGFHHDPAASLRKVDGDFLSRLLVVEEHEDLAYGPPAFRDVHDGVVAHIGHVHLP
jgi:hypothetical protein